MNTTRSELPWPLLLPLCAMLLVPSEVPVHAQPDAGPAPSEKLLSGQQLESLVAPIAMFPDPLLGQVLAACTYPLQAAQADQWLQANRRLKGDDLARAAAKQDWEPSIRALILFPDVLKRISQNLKWSTALGNAFLAQQEDVMNAVQSLRRKAQQARKLQSSAQQRVTTEDGKIIIQPANPRVLYVPNYNTDTVYEAYPTAGGAVAFGPAFALGSYGWGWGCNWRTGSVTVNNNFFGHYGYPVPLGASSTTGTWVHNPSYRGAVPYASAAVAARYRNASAEATTTGSAARMANPPEPSAGASRMNSEEHSTGSVFGDSGGAAATRANSMRGNNSMRGMTGGGRRP